jgi:putative Holliday junction resolvase
MTRPRHQSQPPHRLLALDHGGRRIGVAVSDELGLFAHPRPAVVASGAAAIEAVAALVAAEGADEVIVGLPLTLGGGESEQTAAARRFAEALRARIGRPVSEWDERLTTREAARTRKGAEARKSGKLDSAAATVLLQAVLDSRRGPGG